MVLRHVEVIPPHHIVPLLHLAAVAAATIQPPLAALTTPIAKQPAAAEAATPVLQAQVLLQAQAPLTAATVIRADLAAHHRAAGHQTAAITTITTITTVVIITITTAIITTAITLATQQVQVAAMAVWYHQTEAAQAATIPAAYRPTKCATLPSRISARHLPSLTVHRNNTQ